MQEVFEKIKQKAKERSKKMFVEKLGDKNYVYLQAIGTKELDKIIEQVAKEHNNGWILVSERLPKEKMPVLICNEIGEITSTWYLPYGDEKRFKKFMHKIGESETIAWQPLPEPYQPKGEDKQ